MGARILSFLAVLVLVAGCSSTKDGSVVSTDGGLTQTDRVPLGGYDQANLGAPTPGTQAELVATIGDRVFFGYDRFDLTPEARSVVERQAQWLNTYPNLTAIIEGHCDERGTREYNLALGEKRASTLRNALIAGGVSPSRLQTISYGKERPAVMGSDESSWAQNRRGVLVVQ